MTTAHPSHSAYVMQVGLHQVWSLKQSDKTDTHTERAGERERWRIKRTWAALQAAEWAAVSIRDSSTCQFPVIDGQLPPAGSEWPAHIHPANLSHCLCRSQQSWYIAVDSQLKQHYQVYPTVKQTTPSALISHSIVSLAAAALAVRRKCLSVDCGTPISQTLFFLCVCVCRVLYRPVQACTVRQTLTTNTVTGVIIPMRIP